MSPVCADEPCAAGFAVPAVVAGGFVLAVAGVAGGFAPVVAVGLAVGVEAGGLAF